MKRKLIAGIFGCMCLLGIAFGDGRTYVLSLEGDGSATVVLDEAAHTAYIHDGGRAGRQGIAGAGIGDTSVLEFLKQHNVETLVISCSHPHEDHMGGLKTLLESQAIRGFKKLYFVDAIQDGATTQSGAAIKPLHQIYEDKWSNSPPPEVDHKSAIDADAFAALHLTAGEVSVHNYKYAPGSVGEDEHDNSVIVEIEVRGESGGAGSKTAKSEKPTKRTIVDFDDASTKLINQWAAGKPSRSVNALLMAHHGSRYNNMSAVLEDAKSRGLTDIIFTANDTNRFLHPTPEALEMALEVVGPDHVFVTGSNPGDAIELSPQGPVVRSQPGEARSRLQDFLRARIGYAEEGLKENDNARSRLRLNADLEAMRRIQETLDVMGGSTRAQENGVAAFADRTAMAREDQLRSQNAGRKDEQLPFGVPGASPPNSPDPGTPGGPGVMPPPVGGGGATAAPTPSSMGGVPSGPRGPGGASYSNGGGNGIAGGGGGSGSSRYGQFHTIVAETMAIRFGGVVIGNEPNGSSISISDLQFIPQPKPGTVSIQLTTADGKTATFGPMSNTLLWAAYNFVAPTKYLRDRYPGVAIQADAGGLTGMISNDPMLGWSFALNPAIADTPLAKDAMRLDMAVATAREPDFLPPAARSLPWARIGNFVTYQWYDDPASISVGEGTVTVADANTHDTCLMQLRLLTVKSDEVVFKADDISNEDPEFAAAVKKLADKHLRTSKSPFNNKELANARQQQRLQLAKTRAVVNATASLSDQENLTKDERDKLSVLTIRQIRANAGLLESMVPRDVTAALCHGLPFLKRIDQLAKTVSLLHRYLDTAKKPLPELPSRYIPKFTNVGAAMAFEEVWDDF
jgi:hypothetical protein